MSLEVEQKFHVDDRAALERLLVGLGAVKVGTLQQRDIYFAHPSRDLANSDEAFRIRADSDGTLLCYKGPRKPGNVKIREEIEIPIPDEDLDQLRRMLNLLGFHERGAIKKTRVTWQLQNPGSSIGPVTIALDSVDQLGEFAEVELVVEESDLSNASEFVSNVATSLKLTQVEKHSYIAMLLANS